MAEHIAVIDEEAAEAGQGPVPGPAARTDQGYHPAPVVLTLIGVVLAVGVVTFLGPILKPLLVAVFLYFATRAGAGFFMRRGVPAWLAYLALFITGSAAAAA